MGQVQALIRKADVSDESKACADRLLNRMAARRGTELFNRQEEDLGDDLAITYDEKPVQVL